MNKKFIFLVLSLVATLYGDFSPIQISESPKIFMICTFLSDEECDYMMDLARPRLIPSKVVDEENKGEMDDARRTSEGCFIHNNWCDSIVVAIEKRIAAITSMPIENGEDFNVLRYGVGGEYQPHYDYFNVDTPGGADYALHGGQRVATLIMYLNTPEAGGETIFPKANIFITPRKGDAVLFYNCSLQTGDVDPNSFHGGAPVIAGEKWIMTKWIRERGF